MDLGLTLARNARVIPEKTALIFEGKTMTYQALNQAANQLAHGLIKLGLKKGDHIAMMQLNTDKFPIVFYALMKIGAVAVPLNTKLTSDEASYIINDSDSVALFYDEIFNPVIEGTLPDCPKLKHHISTAHATFEGHLSLDEVMDEEISDPEISVDEADDCEILYTSGTTGRPKGALFDHHRILHVGFTISMTMRIHPDDRLLHVAPLFHSAQLNLFLISGIHLGCTQVIHAQFDPTKVLADIEKYRITLFFGVPTMYNFFLRVPNADQFDLSSVERCGYGAAPMPVAVLEKSMALFKTDQFYNLCGLTEGGPGGVMLTPELHQTKLGKGGKPLLNTEVIVVNAQDEKIKPGEVGEFILRSEMMMKGYYNKPEETAQTMKNGWVYTGDLATIDEDGIITLVDRKKDMIITGGENVYSVQVENVLYAFPDIIEVAVIGEADDTWGERVVGVLVTKDGEKIDEEALKHFCYEKLAKYKVPTKFIYLDAIPRNASGKALKYKLRQTINA